MALAASQSAIDKTCPESDICYSLNIPESTASSGDGDIYFQMTAPTTYSWVALGQGSQMAGSNIFVMYSSADGTNVTVSPRLGTGQVQPKYDTAAQITVLEGSGISDGIMTANVQCSNCQSWSGGTMDFTASSAEWIHAYKSGSALNTDDVEATIAQHADGSSGAFSWDMTSAQGGDSDVNPFVTASTSTNTTGSTSSTASATTSSATTSSSSSGSDSDDSSSSAEEHRMNTIQLTHAVLSSIAFVAFFPIGGILVRVASFAGLVWVHAALQVFGYIIFIAGAGLGIYLAEEGSYWGQAHPIIGIVLLVILFFQPLTGWLHHKVFKQRGGRSIWSHAHLTIGRAAVILGLINGGLGLLLASAGKTAYIAYGVCAGVIGVLYLASIVFGETRRAKKHHSVDGDLMQRDSASRTIDSDGSTGNARREKVSSRV